MGPPQARPAEPRRGLAPGRAYERIGGGYHHRRRPDPRVAAPLLAALGDAATVVNVGAGAGSYEPTDRTVVAVEPSAVMLAQRRSGSAPAAGAVAEALPFPDASFDAALAVLTLHHWTDWPAGLAELRRVARRLVVLHFEPGFPFWLADEYVPQTRDLDLASAPTVAQVVAELGAARVEPVLVPHDCADGFFAAYWRRPAAYLDPSVRAAISNFARLGAAVTAPGLERLRQDLEDGSWEAAHADLLAANGLDAGYRLIVAG